MAQTGSFSLRSRRLLLSLVTNEHSSVPSAMCTAYSVTIWPLLIRAIVPWNLFSAVQCGSAAPFSKTTHGALTSAEMSSPGLRPSLAKLSWVIMAVTRSPPMVTNSTFTWKSDCWIALILPKKVLRALVFREDSFSRKNLDTCRISSSENETKEAVKLGVECPRIF